MLKVGIVGCGKIADSHAWAIQSIKGCEIVGACDAEALMARQFSERFQVRQFFTDVGEMLREARPDVVHVLTPPQSHYSIARQCMEGGCHVYVEKPFTIVTEEAEELLGLATQKNLKVTVGHDAQFSHATRDLRRLVQEGYLGGPPVHMESYYGYEFGSIYGNAIVRDKQHWVRRLPGKLLQNVISHGIARIAEFLCDQKPLVIAHGFVSPSLKSVGEEEIVDELRVIIADQRGTTAYFTFSSQMRPTINQFRIFGCQNGIFLDETQQAVIKLRGHRYKSYAEQFIPHANFSRQYIGNFFRNVSRFVAKDFHMEGGKKCLIDSFYCAVISKTPEPIPHNQILLTSWIMGEIFKQISRKGASCEADSVRGGEISTRTHAFASIDRLQK